MVIFNRCNNYTKIIFFIVVCSFMLNACKVQEKTIYVYQNKHETFNYPEHIFPNVNPLILDGTYRWEKTITYCIKRQAHDTMEILDHPKWIISDTASKLFRNNNQFDLYIKQDSVIMYDSFGKVRAQWRIIIPAYDSMYLITKSLAKLGPVDRFDTVINMLVFRRTDSIIQVPKSIDSVILGRWFLSFPHEKNKGMFNVLTARDTIIFYDDSIAVYGNYSLEVGFKYLINDKNRTLTFKISDSPIKFRNVVVFNKDYYFFIYKLTPDYLELIPASLDCECKHTIGYRKFGYD